MSRMSRIIESKMFKPAPGGYIFQAVPPSIFNPTDAYLVNESHKAQILSITRALDAKWGHIVMRGAFALAVAAGVVFDRLIFDTPLGARVFLDVIIALMAWLVAQTIGTAFLMNLIVRRLEPVLAGLPGSDERLFPTFPRVKFRFALWARPGAGAAALWCAVFGFILGQRAGQHPPFTDFHSTLLLVALVVNLFWAMRGKPKTGAALRPHG